MACYLTAPSHYTGTSVDLLSKVLFVIQVRAISQEVLKNIICNMYPDITLLKLLPHLPGANELIDNITWLVVIDLLSISMISILYCFQYLIKLSLHFSLQFYYTPSMIVLIWTQIWCLTHCDCGLVFNPVVPRRSANNIQSVFS